MALRGQMLMIKIQAELSYLSPYLCTIMHLPAADVHNHMGRTLKFQNRDINAQRIPTMLNILEHERIWKIWIWDTDIE